jgi:cell shape-determining protein MreC
VLTPFSGAPMRVATRLSAALSARQGEMLTKAEARELRAENAALRSQADHWQAASEHWHARFRQLENFQKMYGPISDMACELIPARVVGAGSLPYDQGRVVNSGSRHGVAAGDLATVRTVATSRSKALPEKLAVVTESSLIGRVTDSGAFAARVRLVTDKDFQMSGRIRRLISPNRPRTITVTHGSLPRTEPLTKENNARIDVLFHGDGAGMIVVPGVKAYHNVLPGDHLYASSAEQNIPIEIRVGEVVKVEPSPDAKDAHRVRLHVRPFADVAHARDVFIISPIWPAAERR